MDDKKVKKILELINKDINENKVTIAYQPIISTSSKSVSSLESLFRFDNSVLNCNLEKVIAIAKNNNLLNKITKIVVSNIIEDFSNWINKGVIKENFLISFNISSSQLNEEFFNYLIKELNNKEIQNKNLMIEIKEVNELNKERRDILKRLNKEGFKIALDDFNLEDSYLKDLVKLPYHMIKMDKSFVKNVIDNQSLQKSIVESIINLSKNSNLKVVVNGIENNNDTSAIKDLNADYKQGFLYSKPVFKDEIIETIRSLQ